MDNIQASPSIEVPNVPEGFCPKGNWRQVFQEFINVVLKNATLNVPGLGEVTPQEIDELKAKDVSLQNQIDANKFNFLQGEVATAAGTLDEYIVAFPSTTLMPTSDYFIGLTMVGPASALPAPEPTVFVKSGTQTASGFTFVVDTGIAGWSVRWCAISK
jgi:hypothetical protein